MSTIVQMEAGLSYSALALLRGEVKRPTPIDISNLLSFTHAVIMFGKVVIPAAMGQTIFTTNMLPDSLASADIFSTEISDKYDDLKREAIDQAVSMAATKYGIPQENHALALVAAFNERVKGLGPIWKKHFDLHVARYKNDGSSFMKESIKRVDGYIEVPGYKQLAFDQKVAGTYVWRAFFHTYMALDSNRLYLHNAYRTPFVDDVFNYFNECLVVPELLKGNSSQINVFAEKAPVWKGLLPSLLAQVLSNAAKPRDVPELLLKVRDSNSARAFRAYHAKLQKRLGMLNAAKMVEEDIEKLAKLWADVAPDDVSLPFEFKIEDLSLVPRIPGGLINPLKRIQARFNKRPLRFAVKLFASGASGRELNNHVDRIFGPVLFR